MKTLLSIPTCGAAKPGPPQPRSREARRLYAWAIFASIVDRSGKLTGTVMMLAFAQMLVVAVASDPERATR